MKKIKEVYHYLQTVRNFLRNNSRQKTTLQGKKKLIAIFNGFYTDSFNLYRLNENDPKEYLSDFQILLKCPAINGEFSNILNNKLTFALFFRNEDRIIKPVLYIQNKRIIDFKSGNELSDFSALIKLEEGDFIMKGATGGGGHGIHLLQVAGESWKLDSKTISKEELLKFLKSRNDLLVFHRLKQTGFANTLNPESVNTIRIITMKDPITNEIFIQFAGLRVGRKTSFVDNCEHGGYAYLLDVNTGKAGKAPVLENNQLTWKGNHPDTNDKIEGLIIPDWEFMKQELIKLAQRNSFMPYIGWDVAPMEKDFLIIEGNNHPGLYHFQSLSPMKKHERVKEFYKFHGVI